VRDEDDGCALFAGKVLQVLDDITAGLLVQRRDRLVRKDHGRAANQGTSVGDALALATGQLRGKLVGEGTRPTSPTCCPAWSTAGRRPAEVAGRIRTGR